MTGYMFMLIAIISDIHNNVVNLQKVLTYCKSNDIATIICCGDLASEETLDFLNDNFSGTIYYTFGNMDNDQLRDFEFTDKYKNTFLYKNFGEIEINGLEVRPLNSQAKETNFRGRTSKNARKIAFVHFPEKARNLCYTGRYDFVFYGHTHKPWEEMIGNCKMLNPGNVAGDIYPPTFAVWDTENDSFKLIRVHDLN